MRPRRFRVNLMQFANKNWLGPHFYGDLIRLARKGWPTFVRVLYLVALLVSLTCMYEMKGAAGNLIKPSEYATRAHEYAFTIIVVQNILVLLLLPVYVASSIAEEKENQTLEALTLTHLTDRELVLGKLCGRLMHLGAVVLSGLPILAFMHLWGNVDVAMLLYHETNTLLLLASGGSACIWFSTRADSVFQAVSGSYIFFMAAGIIGLPFVFAIPWFMGSIAWMAGRVAQPTPMYLPALMIVAAAHVGFAWLVVRAAITQMEYLRRREKQASRKTTGSLALTERARQREPVPGKRGQVRSRIHPWAWPIGDDALFWKECLKDGTRWSLSFRWLFVGIFSVPVAGIAYRSMLLLAYQGTNKDALQGNAYSFTFTTYFIALAAYALVVLFQMTMSVAGEREQGTLTFLLMVPADRRAILWNKWLGPWWRNWPILAVSYFGVALGLACGLYGFWTALFLFAVPWPPLLMLGGAALWLSVACRRVLFANVVLVALLGLFCIVHIAAADFTGRVLAFHFAVVGEVPLVKLSKSFTWANVAWPALGEHAVLLLIGSLCFLLAMHRFGKRNH